MGVGLKPLKSLVSCLSKLLKRKDYNMIKEFFTRLFDKLFGRSEKRRALPSDSGPRPQGGHDGLSARSTEQNEKTE